MNKKVKEPFFVARVINMILGFMILGLILIVLHKETNTEVLEMIIFGLAAFANFIASAISFSEEKRMRGNLFSTISAVFLICTVIWAVRLFVFL